MPRTDVEIRSLLAATDIDVLSDASVIEDRGDYVVVRTPTNPNFHWGNFLLWRRAPRAGDRTRWELAFEREFASQPESVHVALTWDDGSRDVDLQEFVDAGYEVEDTVALVAQPHELAGHPRMNREVTVRQLDPDGDAELWDAVVELQVESREPGHTEASYRTFVVGRMADRLVRFRVGEGGWFVALTPDGEVAASCGLVVTEGRGRYQAVDTAERFRRRGIASRLVTDVGRIGFSRLGATHLVIGADADYHALALYESLGFVVRERGMAVTWWPTATNAARHPERGGEARSID